jgi:hypothetical protein
MGLLEGLPIVGDLLKSVRDNPTPFPATLILTEPQDKEGHKETDEPAKHLDTRQVGGNAKGVFGILQSLTSGNVS